MKPEQSASTAGPEPLLERDAELDLLLGSVTRLRVAPNRGTCVLVHGEAGVGKTSLLRRLREVAGADVQWLWGRCEPMLSAPPLAPLLELLDALPLALASAVRCGRANAEVLAGMLALLRERARPLALVIDDAQWADSATLDLLGYIGRRIDSTRALLVVLYRDDDLAADHPLRALLGYLPRHCTERLPLVPLSRAAVSERGRRAGRGDDGLYRATQGNPFFVTELLASGDLAPPAAVRDAVLARAGRLSSDARDVLDLVSMAPNGLEADVLGAVMDASAEAIDECLAVALLQRDGAALRFRHELARGSVEAGCGPQRAANLHAALFDALSLRRAPAARLVHHAAHAGQAAAVLRLAPASGERRDGGVGAPPGRRSAGARGA